jgi:hypothetical protein
MLIAASAGIDLFAAALFVVAYVLPFFVARRIGVRKGRRWFWYAFFLGWIGVLILALLPPRRGAASTVGSDAYHVPPAAKGKGGWMYDQKKR